MKKYLKIIFISLLVILAVSFYKIYLPKKNTASEKSFDKTIELKDGDLIFQTSLSNQSKAIQLATKSKYSHCGIIYKEGNDYVVFEAIQTVRKTSLEKWIKRGQNGHYVVKRLKNANDVLSPQILNEMKLIGKGFNGKSYDFYFEWSDEKIYCSELIWKIYKRATGIEIGKLETLKAFDLSNKIVEQKMKERYGETINLDELVISPAQMFNSDLLTIVKSN